MMKDLSLANLIRLDDVTDETPNLLSLHHATCVDNLRYASTLTSLLLQYHSHPHSHSQRRQCFMIGMILVLSLFTAYFRIIPLVPFLYLIG